MSRSAIGPRTRLCDTYELFNYGQHVSFNLLDRPGALLGKHLLNEAIFKQNFASYCFNPPSQASGHSGPHIIPLSLSMFPFLGQIIGKLADDALS